jgi:hypothetical protein
LDMTEMIICRSIVVFQLLLALILMSENEKAQLYS